MPTKWFTIILSLSVSVFAQNILVNGDFESGAVKGSFANGYPDGWTGWNQNGWHHSDPGYRRDGYGIAIWDNDTGCIQVVNASEGEQFDISGEMIYHATEVLVNKNAILKIEFWDGPHPAGSKLDENQVGALTPIHSAATWYTFSDTVTAPVGTTEARIICQTISTGGTSTGKAYWDNIVLESEHRINSPDYDNNLRVDLLDFLNLAREWNQTSSTYNLAGTNTIDLEDLAVFFSAWSPSADPYPGYDLVWSDEFDGTSIDTTNWNFETGGNWYNNEIQYYTSRPENARVENGNLVIEAREEVYGNRNHTSARMTTQNKQFWTYGKMEARIKLPSTQGVWPAFWMMPNNTSSGWPQGGEIDIMEAINVPTWVKSSLHFGSNDPYTHDSAGTANYYLPGGGSFANDFHIYGMEWEPDIFKFFVDGVLIGSMESWWSAEGAFPAPFNKNFFFILNVAVGGDWPGDPDGSSVFPQSMYVDYVRVYQLQP